MIVLFTPRECVLIAFMLGATIMFASVLLGDVLASATG